MSSDVASVLPEGFTQFSDALSPSETSVSRIMPQPLNVAMSLGDELGKFLVDQAAHSRFKHIDKIGVGSTGFVEEVKDKRTGLLCARKRVDIVSQSRRKEIQAVFANEIKTIGNLQGHQHFVSIVAAYATENDFNLVMQPRASGGDLARFLEVYLSPKGKLSDLERGKMTMTLERVFGCGASGLAFMHQRRIRHRDIKPRNILIHDGAIVYADFGYSRDSSLFEHSATRGPVDAQTKRYSAPEVLLWDERDSKSDVYSLGCVFIEVFFALTWATAALEPGKLFSKEMDRLHTWFAQEEFASRLEFLPKMICCMTLRPPQERVEASQLCCDLLGKTGFACPQCWCQLSAHQKAQSERGIRHISKKATARVDAVKEISMSGKDGNAKPELVKDRTGKIASKHSPAATATKTHVEKVSTNLARSGHSAKLALVKSKQLDSSGIDSGSKEGSDEDGAEDSAEDNDEGVNTVDAHLTESVSSDVAHESNPVINEWIWSVEYARYYGWVADTRGECLVWLY
jgi:serine/threonine protein kinase